MTSDAIIQIFCKVLDVQGVHEESDFFDLGGDSLLATRVLSAIVRDFGVELLYDDFADEPTPAGVLAKVAAGVS